MLKLKPNSMKLPVGGHQYPDHGVMFRGDGFDELVKKVNDFRLANAIPLGNPQQDVLTFYALNWPYLVEEDHEPAEEEDSQFLIWRKWIHDTWRNPPQRFCSNREYAERCVACEKCPYNTPFEFPDTDEVAELKRRTFLLRRGIDTSKKVHFCALHGADISALCAFETPLKSVGSSDPASKGKCPMVEIKVGL